MRGWPEESSQEGEGGDRLICSWSCELEEASPGIQPMVACIMENHLENPESMAKNTTSEKGVKVGVD